MKILVVYDSQYGNTEKIARAIGGGVFGEIEVIHVGKASASALENIDFMFIGSPTQGGRATQPIHDFIERIPAPALKRLTFASFDTRLSTKWVGIFGFAAGRIAHSLKSKGATLAANPELFFVTATKGPLKEGELERAAIWAKETVKNACPARL